MGTEEKIKEIEQQTQYISVAINSADQLVKSASTPWKWAVVGLVIAVSVCVYGWVSTSNRHMDTIDKLNDHIVSLQEQLTQSYTQ